MVLPHYLRQNEKKKGSRLLSNTLVAVLVLPGEELMGLCQWCQSPLRHHIAGIAPVPAPELLPMKLHNYTLHREGLVFIAAMQQGYRMGHAH